MRNLLVSMIKHRLASGVGASTIPGAPRMSIAQGARDPADAQHLAESLGHFLDRDDRMGLDNLCRQLCANRSKEFLGEAREAFASKNGSWLDVNGESRVLSRLKGDTLLHCALSVLFNEPAVHFVNRLYRELATIQPQPSKEKSGAGRQRRPSSIKSTWQLDGGAATESLTHLVTVCRDAQLRRVAELLDLAPYNTSLGTIILSVPDSETRKLLAFIADTAVKRRGSGSVASLTPKPSARLEREGSVTTGSGRLYSGKM